MVLLFLKVYIIIGELFVLGCLSIPEAGPMLFKSFDQVPSKHHFALGAVMMAIMVILWPYIIFSAICKSQSTK